MEEIASASVIKCAKKAAMVALKTGRAEVGVAVVAAVVEVVEVVTTATTEAITTATITTATATIDASAKDGIIINMAKENPKKVRAALVALVPALACPIKRAAAAPAAPLIAPAAPQIAPAQALVHLLQPL